jgi:hypothetical protein
MAYPKRNQSITTAMYDIEVAWAAVAAADRVNGGKYINQNSFPYPEGCKFNKAIAYDMCEAPHQLLVEDKELGVKLHEHFQGLLFKRLTGSLTNGFLNNIADVVSKKQVNRFDVACMSALVKTYRQDIEREKKLAREQDMASTSEYIGLVGAKKMVNVEIIDIIYSKNYNTHIITATDGTNMIKFMTSQDPALYVKGSNITIQGSIKRCAENDRTGVKETWLNRVKRI